LYELGQLILEIDHVMVGFVLTQRIKNIDELDNSSEISVNKIQDVEGSVLHIIALYVLPEKHIVEEYFLEFIIHKVLVSSNITHIALVTRSQNYPGNDVIGMESYVEELQQEKGSADIATRLHFKQGAQIIKPIANYRPNDEKNLGYGILLLYDKESRKLNSHQNIARNISGGPVELNPDLIKTIVDENFKLFLRQKETGKKIEYNPMSTFEELGLESMQLLELRALLSGEFSVDLPLNFFILHETPNHIINHFIEIKLKPYKEWLYETKWVSRANPEVKVLEPNKTWIVFSDSNEQISSSIIEHLHGHKQKCITILSRNNFQKIDESTFSIRSISQDDYKQLFNEIQNFNEIAGVIYLCGLCDEVSELRDPPLSVLEGFHRYSLEGLILLVNNLATLKFPNPPRLWVVTKSIEQDGGVDSLSEWPLYALSKIIKEEYQKFQCTYIAINGQESPIEASERLFEEIEKVKDLSPVLSVRLLIQYVSRNFLPKLVI
jgi:acyl carrier protein